MAELWCGRWLYAAQHPVLTTTSGASAQKSGSDAAVRRKGGMGWAIQIQREITLAAMRASDEEIVGAITYAPAEGCRFVQFENIAAGRERAFDVDAAALIDLMQSHVSLVALVHSHPRGPAELSVADHRSFVADGRPTYPGVALVVAAPDAFAVFVFDEKAARYRPVGADLAVLRLPGA